MPELTWIESENDPEIEEAVRNGWRRFKHREWSWKYVKKYLTNDKSKPWTFGVGQYDYIRWSPLDKDKPQCLVALVESGFPFDVVAKLVGKKNEKDVEMAYNKAVEDMFAQMRNVNKYEKIKLKEKFLKKNLIY